jgi:hypothetical protein
MTGEAVVALILASLPVIGAAVALLLVYLPKWERRRALRKLDEMFEADREWWEEQFRGVGDERPPE